MISETLVLRVAPCRNFGIGYLSARFGSELADLGCEARYLMVMLWGI